jgi:FtsP/CotA-like multicopper oxidase with cupredoxin domain
VLPGLASVVVGLSFAGASARVSRGSSSCHRGTPPILHDGFPEPPAIYSQNGVLNIRLRAAFGPTRINRRRVMAMTYNGSYPGPTLAICAGDTLTVHLVNALKQPTNLHTHGFHVSPKGNSDNVFVRINPGKTFTYRYHIPLDMDPGAYWYHPHLHTYVNDQIFQGLAGAIVERGGLDRLPALRKVPQRWIVITDTEVRNGRALPISRATDPRSPWIVNGVIDPTATIRPGQLLLGGAGRIAGAGRTALGLSVR